MANQLDERKTLIEHLFDHKLDTLAGIKCFDKNAFG